MDGEKEKKKKKCDEYSYVRVRTVSKTHTGTGVKIVSYVNNAPHIRVAQFRGPNKFSMKAS